MRERGNHKMAILDCGPPSPSRDRDGIGRCDLIGKYLYRGNVSEEQPIKYGHSNQVWARDFGMRIAKTEKQRNVIIITSVSSG